MNNSTTINICHRKAGHGRRRHARTAPAVTTVIVVSVVVLFAIALVVSQLVRMKEWLKKSPPLPPPIKFDDERDDKP